jgi:hypothetical protein
LERIEDRDGKNHGDENARQSPGQSHAAEKRDQDHAQRDEADDGMREDLEQRQETDQRETGAADRAQESGPWNGSPHRIARQSQPQLEEPHQHSDRHAHLPAEHRVARDEIRRSQHREGHPEDAGSVQAERHRRDIAAPGPAGEPSRHRRIDQIPDEHADGRARHHAVEHDLAGKMESAHEDRRQDYQIRHVIEHQGEEGVEVPRAKPAIAVHSRGFAPVP